MDIILAAKYISSGFIGMLAAGALYFFVGLPTVYDQRFEVLQQTIVALEQQIVILREQNAQLIAQNKQLQTQIESLAQEVARLSGYPLNSRPSLED